MDTRSGLRGQEGVVWKNHHLLQLQARLRGALHQPSFHVMFEQIFFIQTAQDLLDDAPYEKVIADVPELDNSETPLSLEKKKAR